MSNLLSVESTFFTILGYPLSYIEFFGTISCLVSVLLIARRNVLTWPVGILSVVLYMMLFYQIRLYSDAAEQVYYLGASVYGWWYWSRPEPVAGAITDVAFSRMRMIVGWLAVTVVLAAVLGLVMSHIHEWASELFPEPASYPFLDALTTAMSLVAMWLMARKHIESWIYWIVVDVIGIWLYFVKDVRFVSLLYVILLAMAIFGLINWMRVGRLARQEAQGDCRAPLAEKVKQ